MWRFTPKKISEFTGAGSLDGTELVPIVKGGENDTATTAEIAALASGPGGGAVDSVNGQTGTVALTQNDIPDGTTAKQYTQTEKTKLAGVATAATANDTDANLKNRANHTGTQPASTISDFSTAADARVAAAAGVSVASLSGGKVPSSQLPAVALTNVQTAASQAAQLALTTQEGDVVVRTDENKTYMRNAGTAGTMADFTLLNTPTDAVTSVNGQSGAVVLDASDVGAQPTDAQLTAVAALADAAGHLANDGAGNLSWEASTGGGGQVLYDILVDAAGGGDYTTFEAALAAATSGQTVYVKNGTYTPASGTHVTSPTNITVVGESAQGVVIDMTVNHPIFEFDGDYTTLRNLGFKTSASAAIQLFGNSSMVTGCYSVSTSSNGNEWYFAGSNTRVINNSITVGASNGSVLFAAQNMVVSGNVLLSNGNANSVFQFQGQGTTVTGNYIGCGPNMPSNNGGGTRLVYITAGVTFTGNEVAGAGGNMVGIRLTNAGGSQITGNRITGNSIGVQDQGGGSNDVVVSGNTIVMSYLTAFGNGSAVAADGGSTGWVITGNSYSLVHDTNNRHLGIYAISLAGSYQTCNSNNVDNTWDKGISNSGDHNTVIGNTLHTVTFDDSGTNTDTGAPAGGGGTTIDRAMFSTAFETTGRYGYTTSGVASVIAGNNGIRIGTTSGGAGFAYLQVGSYNLAPAPLYENLPKWSLSLAGIDYSGNNNAVIWLTMGSTLFAAGGTVGLSSPFVGFKCVPDGSYDWDVYGIVCVGDGTTAHILTSALGKLTGASNLNFEFTAANNVTFSYRNYGAGSGSGSLSGFTMPANRIDPPLHAAIDNDGSIGRANISLGAFTVGLQV